MGKDWAGLAPEGAIEAGTTTTTTGTSKTGTQSRCYAKVREERRKRWNARVGFFRRGLKGMNEGAQK